MLPSAGEKKQIELYSGEFYAACTVGGILSCGLTHTAVTPLDVVKCNSQVTLAGSCAVLVPSRLTACVEARVESTLFQTLIDRADFCRSPLAA